MSRIYEALRRADLERKTRLGAELHPVEETTANLEFTEHQSSVSDPQAPAEAPALAGVMTAEVATCEWEPVIDAIPCLQERGAVVEQFRGLRSKLTQARQDAAIKSVLVSSGMPSEGKSFVTVNLAMSLVREGVNRVLLIDGDLRRPTLHNLLGTSNTPGLSEYLAGKAEPREILQQWRKGSGNGGSFGYVLEHLTFIPSGASSENSSELVANGRMDGLLSTLAPHFDWILIDSPPVLAVTDAVDLARNCDAVLLVAREARTPYQVVQRAQAAFRQSRLLGVVLNNARRIQRDGYNYYSYYYGSAEPREQGKRKKRARSKG
ncbi:MAG TPA: CpsD/CapB family tyrosine-protein kinase [Terracidiphilus sp.]|nr:CpsD/CapB family tyrosine-protein kinase [Terracidiphilus sp.]